MSEQPDKRATFSSFGIKDFIREKTEMEDFRRNCYGENMTFLWNDLQEMYVPQATPKTIRHTYTVSEGGEVVPDRIFLENDDDDGILRFKEPLVGIKVHTAISILTQRTPDVKWDSDSPVYERQVPILDQLRKSDWYDVQTRQQYVMLWFYYVLFGTTFWRRFFSHVERDVQTPIGIDPITRKLEFKKGKIIETSQTVGRAYSPLEVLIDENTKPFAPDTLKKCIYTDWFTPGDFVAEFEGKVPKKRINEALKSVSNPTDRKGTVANENRSKIRVDYYESEYLDLYYVVVNDKTKLIKSPLPARHKKLSLMMASWMPRNDRNPFGLGPIEMMREDKLALDEFKSMTFTQAKFSIYKSILYQGSLEIEGQEAGEVRIRPDRAYKVSSVRDVDILDMKGPGQDAWKALAELRARVDDASGINKPLGGEITKSTAFEADMAKDAALSRLSVPIRNITTLLTLDAQRMLELQRQYYGTPQVKEIVNPEDMIKAAESIDFFEQNGIPTPFKMFVDSSDEENPRIMVEKSRTVPLNLSPTSGDTFVPSTTKTQFILSDDVFRWKGKIHVVEDSLLTITPTLDRSKKLEMMNILIPQFGQPPELMAKVSKETVQLYGEDYRQFLPENFLAHLDQLNQGKYNTEQAGAQANAVSQELRNGPQEGGAPGGALNFQDVGAPKAVRGLDNPGGSVASQAQTVNKFRK